VVAIIFVNRNAANSYTTIVVKLKRKTFKRKSVDRPFWMALQA
jgi:hypothetical protein